MPPLVVCAHSTASITAHIVDADGHPLGPMSNVQPTLEAAEDQQFVQSVWPNEKSDLKADGLNTYLPVPRASAPYPPIYFPGVSSRSDAQVITLAAASTSFCRKCKLRKEKNGRFLCLWSTDLVNLPHLHRWRSPILTTAIFMSSPAIKPTRMAERRFTQFSLALSS